MMTRTGTVVTLLFGVAAISAGCGRQSESVAAPAGQPPLSVRLDYLHHLGLDAAVNARPVRVVSLYAEAPDYRPTGSPERDGFEGIASVDDAARAAVAYLRSYETTGDARARDEALSLLSFVSAMEKGDGEFVNFIDANGRQNLTAPSSRKSMSYWGARSVWALGRRWAIDWRICYSDGRGVARLGGIATSGAFASASGAGDSDSDVAHSAIGRYD